MPYIISILVGALVSATGTIVGRVLVSLGFGYVTYEGVQLVLTWVKNGISQSILALPPDVVSILSGSIVTGKQIGRAHV